MDVDNQSEDGEIKRTPGHYSEEEGEDTADSLEIKPPQAVVRHRKTTSHRREKHSDRSREKEYKSSSRHHERSDERRHNDRHRSHRRHESDQIDKARRSDPQRRERELARFERKERSTGDRALEDLRENGRIGKRQLRSESTMWFAPQTEDWVYALLDKRRERREEPREYKKESRSRGEEQRMSDGRGERREVRIEEVRELRETRNEEQRSVSRHSRQHMEQETVYADVEIIESHRSQSSREKRHKRSHKSMRDREREKLEKEIAYREKHIREQHIQQQIQQQQHQQQAMEVSEYEEYERMESVNVEHHGTTSTKDPKEMKEQEERRQKLLEAEREMARRKETSRIELEARRLKRGEKRPHSPEPIIPSSDESTRQTAASDETNSQKSGGSRASEEARDSDRESGESSSSDSSSSTSDDEETDSDQSQKGKQSNDSNSDYNNPSPISVDQLAKSDRSDGGSPGHVETNGTAKSTETIDVNMDASEEGKKELAEQMELPPYFPAIQGCRNVEEYKCLNRIAEGTYGVVYRAEDRRTKEIVALKRLKMEKEKEGFPITSLREINTLLKAQHPNIVTVREIVVGSNMDKIFIVMDYVEHDLKSLMETMKAKNQGFTSGEIKCLMLQLLRAVAHMHDNWILHRDLKTSNLLLSHRGILKVGDFGLAREYGSPLKQYTSIVVTLWYRAPELLLGGKEYSTPIDMWSVGCIFAELIRMEALFPGKSEIDLLNRVFKELGTPSDKIWPGYSKLPMVRKIPFAHYPVNNIRQRFSLTLSDLGIEMLSKFLTYDPAQRITAEDALKHDYFSERPLPIDPALFPTWPAKSEFGARTLNASPKPPSGGKDFKQIEDDDGSSSGFHMGSREVNRQLPAGGGFHLKF